MKKGFKWNRKGVSPVIATIIIVAIAIVMSIAVAYWMLGLGSSFTKYEKLEFTGAYATLGGGNFTIHMTVKNTGSATATIDVPSILYNGKPDIGYASSAPFASFGKTTLDPGGSTTGTITMPDETTNSTGAWVSGMTIEILVHTTAGKDYPKVVSLP